MAIWSQHFPNHTKFYGFKSLFCKNIKTFTKNVSYEEFTENLEKVYAVAKAFENIGEAVKNIPKELTELIE